MEMAYAAVEDPTLAIACAAHMMVRCSLKFA